MSDTNVTKLPEPLAQGAKGVGGEMPNLDKLQAAASLARSMMGQLDKGAQALKPYYFKVESINSELTRFHQIILTKIQFHECTDDETGDLGELREKLHEALDELIAKAEQLTGKEQG